MAGIRPEDWDLGFDPQDYGGDVGGGGFDFGEAAGLSAAAMGGPPGLGMYAAGKGIGLFGDLITQFLGGKEKRRAREAFETERGSLMGSMGEKPFKAEDIGQYYMKMLTPDIRKRAESVQDITGNVRSADAFGAILEELYPQHLRTQAGLKERSAMAGFSADQRKRLAAFNAAVQRMINA
ncbi:hypothetical protein KAR91_05550 [Candidatus Pacearchaeota archaeon]|nr:hypothetical protein [Candidatus Pacearchaeota archaeon]